MPRLVSVGRLDIGTEGLLLLTNDGGLARVLELPKTQWVRRYRVRAHGRVTQADLDRLADGITVDGVHYGPITATLEREQGSNLWLSFEITEGKNREVRNVLGHLGLQVNRLIRVAFGPFALDEMAEGAIEEVETKTLRAMLGAEIIAAADCDFSGPATVTSARGVREPDRRTRGAGGFAKNLDTLASRVPVATIVPKSLWGAHGAAMPGARMMHRSSAPIAAHVATISRSAMRTPRSDAPAS